MSRKTTSLVAWEPSPEQTYAAKMLAWRKTWRETADEVGVDISTVCRWMGVPGFRELVDQYVQAVATELDHQLVAGAEEMLTLWRQMVRGEVSPDDKRLNHIAPTVNRYFASAIAWDDASSEGKGRTPGMAVQFNIGGRESPGDVDR